MTKALGVAVLLFCHSVSPGSLPIWRVWNVGQGAFTTVISEAVCLHIEIGGERWPQEVQALCRGKQNWVGVSHADYDHWGFIFRLRGSVCLIAPIVVPPGLPARKLLRLNRLRRCDLQSSSSSSFGSSVGSSLNWQTFVTSPLGHSSSNEVGRWFLAMNQVLVTGDSPQSQERQMIESISGQPKWLLLGHHGSRSSTSENLLRKLKHLRGAIASARQVVYGHPHIETQLRLKKARVPLIKTEDWGHLQIELAPD